MLFLSTSLFFFFYCYAHHRDLHSFPTRRSSDLTVSVVVNVTVSNTTGGGGDTTAPTVAITNPSNGAWTGNSIEDRKSTRLNSSHTVISYAVFCLKKKKKA